MAPNRNTRLAIIGCGNLTPMLMRALRRIDWRPSILIDDNSQNLDAVSQKRGRKSAVIKSSHWESVINDFDAALVISPMVLGKSIGPTLIEAGKHVFLPTPFAVSGNDYRIMIEEAQRRDLTLLASLPRRYMQATRWTKALLDSRVLGELRHVHASQSLTASSVLNAENRLQLNWAGGRILTGSGGHTLDLLLWWLGDISHIGYWDDNQGGVEADCILKLGFVSGASGKIDFSHTRHLSNSVRIEGTHGFVELDLYTNRISAGSSNAMAFQHCGETPHGMKSQSVSQLFEAELIDFSAGVATRRHVAVSGAAKTLSVIERCYADRQQLIEPWAIQSPVETTELPKLPKGAKVLVSGATGFVGGRLVERLVREHGAQVRCIIRDVGRAARLGRLPLEIIHADLTNADEVDRAVLDTNYVFHCAYDVRSRRQNIDGLRNIIDACTRHSVRCLVDVSTFAVYEPFSDGPLTEDAADGDRTNTYVDTKLDLEKMIFDAVKNQKLAATVIQPSIVYGPFCWPWTNTPAEMLISGTVILPDRGEGLCNAIYIDDLIDGMVLAAISPAAIGERFILSGPQPVTWATFFGEIARALGTKPPQFQPYDQIVKENSALIRNIRKATFNPKHFIKMVIKSKWARRFLQTALDSAPARLRVLLANYYFASGQQSAGGLFLPNRQALALYRSKATAGSHKARTQLGYQPRFDFQQGMKLTGKYLKWAYKDARNSS